MVLNRQRMVLLEQENLMAEERFLCGGSNAEALMVQEGLLVGDETVNDGLKIPEFCLS